MIIGRPERSDGNRFRTQVFDVGITETLDFLRHIGRSRLGKETLLDHRAAAEQTKTTQNQNSLLHQFIFTTRGSITKPRSTFPELMFFTWTKSPAFPASSAV